MCGLCGILEIADRSSAPPDARLITRMTDTIVHRGPNSSGVHCEGRIGLGFRRLSIIDLSSAGDQPMFNEDKTVALVYNGETYNFQELREQFRLDEKHRFKSRTDSEVIVHLYEELGLDMLPHLSGMYGFAIWDAKAETLHLVRDRYGIKPLFYQKDDTHFRFGSEIKAILADDRVPRAPSAQALHDFLTFNYIPGTQTAFEGIHEVKPGHVLSVTKTGEITERRYWDLDFRNVDHSITEKQAIERSWDLMNESLDRHLIADVPIGVFLSGGLDSSTLCALMKRKTSEPIHTYSVGFEDQSFNELPFARIMAEACDTVHREVLVDADKVRAMLPKYLASIDEPYGDGSAIPTWYVSEIAKDEVVVVLSGEGGDECFAGYDTYKAYQVSKWFSKVPGFIRNGMIKPFANALPVSDKKLSFEFKLKRFLGGQDLPPEEAHLWWRIVLGEEQKLGLYTDRVRDQALLPTVRHFREGFAHANAEEELSGLMYLDSTVFMPDDLMIKNDRMTMAHSLEARVPFCDPALTEYLATVPAALKMKGGKKKHLMREAMRGHLPDEILNKPKVGLEMPYSRWLKAELNDVLMKYLGPENIERTGLFRPEGIRQLVEEHVSNKRDHGRPLWGLLNYMMWYDLYIDG